MRDATGWIEATRKAFERGVPNGWLLGWDRSRFGEELAVYSRPWPCFNATSFDYARCNRYEIECRGDEGGRFAVLSVLVSFVVDAYVMYWTVHEEGRARVCQAPQEPWVPSGIVGSMKGFLESSGFQEMSGATYAMPMDNIALELSDPDDVTLGKCCFEDFG